jgi:RNA polymerase sigma-70 factor (ECF subfamily)
MHEDIVVTEELSRAPNESDLIERAKGRDPEAWAEIYSTHYRAVFRYAKARVFEQDTAEDLASATFVGAIKSIGTFKVASHQREMLRAQGRGAGPRGTIRRWLQRGPGKEPAAADDPVECASGGGDPAELVDGFDLRDALKELPEIQREVVILRFFVGLSAGEVAELMDKRPAAIYSLQARALLSLRERLS